MELIQEDQVMREQDNLEDQVVEEELQFLFQQEQEMLEDITLLKEIMEDIRVEEEEALVIMQRLKIKMDNQDLFHLLEMVYKMIIELDLKFGMEEVELLEKFKEIEVTGMVEKEEVAVLKARLRDMGQRMVKIIQEGALALLVVVKGEVKEDLVL